MFPFICHDFDDFYWPGRIWRVKNILVKIWEMEWNRQGHRDQHRSISISTATYRTKLDNCYDMGDGTSWFEFELAKKDEAGMYQQIFANTNWRHDKHIFVSADRALAATKAFLKEYEITGNLIGTTPGVASPAKVILRGRPKAHKKIRVPDGVAPEDAYMYER